jgi:protein gp37
MGLTTKIAWTDATCNLWWGCVEVAPGCDHCYARTLSARYGHDVWGNDQPRLAVKAWMPMLNKAQNRAIQEGRPYRVFVGSMMDIFERPQPLVSREGVALGTTQTVRAKLFSHILDDHYGELRFQFLTKRPTSIRAFWPYTTEHANRTVWFGTSVTSSGDLRFVRQLIESAPKAAKRFVSAEPLTGPIQFGELLRDLDWVILGGESGAQARPCHSEWIYDALNECRSYGVPVFVKQLGQHATRGGSRMHLIDSHGADPDEWPGWLRVQEEMPV